MLFIFIVVVVVVVVIIIIIIIIIIITITETIFCLPWWFSKCHISEEPSPTGIKDMN